MKVSIKDLQLADIVRLQFEGPYNTATVKQVTVDTVVFFRPFVHTGDFSHTGGVSTYIGIEEFTVFRDMEGEYEVLERKNLT